MATVVFHEHPAQGGACLRGAFRAYMDRIPLEGVPSLDAVWTAIVHRPFVADDGGPGAETRDLGDLRCQPTQRSRVWPDSFNCWEATAHFARAAEHFLPEGWRVHVWDRDLTLPSGRTLRHCWPSLQSPRSDHFLIDLESVIPRAYGSVLPQHGYHGVLCGPANGEWWQELLGGLHTAARVVGNIAGSWVGNPKLGDAVGDQVEGFAGDTLPAWSRRTDAAKAAEKKAPEKTPATTVARTASAAADPAPSETPRPPGGAVRAGLRVAGLGASAPTDQGPREDDERTRRPARPQRPLDLMDDGVV